MKVIKSAPVAVAEAVCKTGLAMNERVAIYKLRAINWSHLVTICKTLNACRLVAEVEFVDEETIDRVCGEPEREAMTKETKARLLMSDMLGIQMPSPERVREVLIFHHRRHGLLELGEPDAIEEPEAVPVYDERPV